MILYAVCPSCKTDIVVKSSSASTRPDLEQEKGETFRLLCSECGSEGSCHVNDVHAKTSSYPALFGIAISVVVTIYLWRILGAVSTLTFVIPWLVWQQQEKAARLFNSYKIRRNS